MDIEIREESLTNLAEHTQISIAFQVECILVPRIDGAGLGGISLVEVPQESPYLKDYDAIAGNAPSGWTQRFDTSNWALISAWRRDVRVGGMVIAHASEGVDLLEGRLDLAVLWDLRVTPRARNSGVGSKLFAASEQWARSKRCVELKAETQNINVPACRFYAKQGCELGAIHRFAYPNLPDEIQLLWYKRLTSDRSAGAT